MNEHIKRCGVVYENTGWIDSLIWEGAMQFFREKAFNAQETTTQVPTGGSLLSWGLEGLATRGCCISRDKTWGIPQGGRALKRRVTLTDRKALDGFEWMSDMIPYF